MKEERKEYFISYSRHNPITVEKVQKFIRRCKRLKIPYILDDKDICINDGYGVFIKNNIEQSKYRILFICDNYFKSDWCMRELVEVFKAEKMNEDTFCVLEDCILKKLDSKIDFVSEIKEFWGNKVILIIDNVMKSYSSEVPNDVYLYLEYLKHISLFIDFIYNRKNYVSMEEVFRELKINGRNPGKLDNRRIIDSNCFLDHSKMF